ncbi:response regulator transcription factor [Deinococcus maricopensis]|uniref:Response regulator receiver protein n=1 Tax=Deinococcus maricopensis (strain DSM 21211 / LMG 22137 / NRRL B-23946 / LB-34) TaxID=709986 RepID=E8U8S4_DEIML|nr:response regulator [Deinococcus maricopensis]ADV67463.1 response regulator receiver protein [Deinococcus maricopensis DSM 21211]
MSAPHLLLVDDERQILELLELTLTMNGFMVSTAQSGAEAVDLAAQRHFDLILLDVVMTPCDGFETARQLRARPGCPPIVFLTGLGGDDERQRGLDLGAAYLVKPFRPAQLLDTIRATLA